MSNLSRERFRWLLAGGLAGLVNGFFGGGGGSVLVPLLTQLCKLDQRRAFATSVAVILPLCALSVVIYLLRGEMDWSAALPYAAGGAIGGWMGGKCFKGVQLPWLKRTFGALLIYGGVRCSLSRPGSFPRWWARPRGRCPAPAWGAGRCCWSI